jgi:hypothetical protein
MSNLREFSTIAALENAIRKIIQQAISNVYLEPLQQPITGLSTVPIQQILEHLYKNHGKLNSSDIAEAKKVAAEPWDPTLPVQTLFNRIKKSSDLLTHAEEPLTDKQTLRIAYDAVLKTGLFSKSLKEWRRKPTADQTWSNFKAFMAKEYQDYLEDESAEDGIYGANGAAHNETMTALEGILSNMSAYQASITNLNDANVTLQTRNDELKTAINALTNQVAKLAAKVTALEATKPQTPTSPPTETGTKRWKKYCYTCGSNWHHNSRNCPIAAPDHKKEASWKNQMGGSTKDHTTAQ